MCAMQVCALDVVVKGTAINGVIAAMESCSEVKAMPLKKGKTDHTDIYKEQYQRQNHTVPLITPPHKSRMKSKKKDN